MQESETAPETATAAAPSWKDAFRNKATAVLVALIAFLGLVIVFRNAMPGADGRDAHTALPWAGENMSLTKAAAVWKSSAGDERMELRVAYYPQVTLELGDCKGDGMLYLNFFSVTGSQIGDTVSLRYTAQGFAPANNDSVQAGGKTAVARMAKGFETEGDYTLHTIKQDEQLWRVVVRSRAAGGEMRTLGYISVLPE